MCNAVWFLDVRICFPMCWAGEWRCICYQFGCANGRKALSKFEHKNEHQPNRLKVLQALNSNYKCHESSGRGSCSEPIVFFQVQGSKTLDKFCSSSTRLPSPAKWLLFDVLFWRQLSGCGSCIQNDEASNTSSQLYDEAEL